MYSVDFFRPNNINNKVIFQTNTKSVFFFRWFWRAEVVPPGTESCFVHVVHMPLLLSWPVPLEKKLHMADIAQLQGVITTLGNAPLTLHCCANTKKYYLCSVIFRKSNNIRVRIRSFLESWIIFVFIFGHFWKAE